MPLFISYSKKDIKIVEKIESYFKSFECKVFRDESFYERAVSIPADQIHNKITESNAFIVVLSKNTLESNYVKQEIDWAFTKKLESSEFLFQVIDLDGTIKDPKYKFIDLHDAIDIRNSKSFKEGMYGLVKSYLKYKREIRIPTKLVSDETFNKLFNTDEDIEDMTVINQKLSALIKETANIHELLQTREHIFTKSKIAQIEQKVKRDVWVFSKCLKNELDDPNIFESFKNNLQKGVRYSYFIPSDSNLALENRERLESKIDNSLQDQVKFIICEPSFLVISSEIVIYDPLDVDEARGYFQVRYRNNESAAELSDCFFVLPQTEIIQIIRTLKTLEQNTNSTKELS